MNVACSNKGGVVSEIAGPELAPLFEPIELPGGLQLKNRICMPGLTRCRAHIDGTPTDLMADYYSQRADAALIITESCPVSAQGRSFLFSPGMYTTEHAIAWRKVTDAVHRNGGKIVLQMNHTGRASNLQFLSRPISPLAPSAIQIPRNSRKITLNAPRVTPYDVPRAIETKEIALIVDEFRRATMMADFAGFDGVQIHADSGYLIHQFLSTNVNQREDRYGGSVENRARFLLEIVDACVGVKGPEYVSVKLTPGYDVHEIEEDDSMALYSYIIGELNNRGDLSFLQLYMQDLLVSEVYTMIWKSFTGAILSEGSLKAATYAKLIEDGLCEMISFGRAYIANPDLATRLKVGAPLSQPDYMSFYSQDATGYTDYPFWNPDNPDESVVSFYDEYDDGNKMQKPLNIL